MQNKNSKLPKIYIKTGDKVKVLAGNHKSKTGDVIKVFTKTYRALVAGINIVHKHVKPSAKNPQGTIMRKEAPVHISNLMVIDPKDGIASRVGRRVNEAGKLQRYSKKSGNFIKND